MTDQPEISYIWTIVERFYRTYRLYALQYENYERQVAEYVQRLGVPRDEIRLDATELSGLLQFRQLERIRDAFLEPLKDACHALFRRRHETDLLDRFVNDIFHEISILKEEHYNIMTYDAKPADRLDQAEQAAILDEVHEMFPIKVSRLHHLFDEARKRIETILPRYKSDIVLIRSLFLHREGFVADAYDDGLVQFYRILYGQDRPFRGFLLVGESYMKSSFFDYAASAFAEGERFLQSVSPAKKRRWSAEWKDARDAFKRHRRECEVEHAQLSADE